MPLPFDLCIIGVAAYGIAAFLDHAMDYGQALGRVRWQIAYWLGQHHHRKALLAMRHHSDFHERLQNMDDLYHMVAIRRPYLVLILCRKCMAFWVCLALALATGSGVSGFAVMLGTSFALSIFDR